MAITLNQALFGKAPGLNAYRWKKIYGQIIVYLTLQSELLLWESVICSGHYACYWMGTWIFCLPYRKYHSHSPYNSRYCHLIENYQTSLAIISSRQSVVVSK